MPDRSSKTGQTPAAKRGAGNHSGRAPNKGQVLPDINEIAFRVAQQATQEPDPIIEEKPEAPRKNPAAVTLGRLGGLKGGKARAEALTPEQRAEIAKKAAEKRWKRASDE